MQRQLVGRPQLLRDLNYRAVLETIALKGPLSRVEVAKHLSLSQPSVSRVADALIQADLIQEGGRIASKAGRKQILLDLNPEAAVVGGLSIRSKFLRLMLTNLKGEILVQEQVQRETQSAVRLVRQVKKLLNEKCKSLGSPLAAICVGVSGAWDRTSRVVHSAPNLAYLEDVDFHNLLAQELEDTLSNDTILVDNDVNYAALGEYTYGAAQAFDSFFYLNLGSGIGGGAVVNGKLHVGFQGFAGEISFLPIYHNGRYHPLEDLVSRFAIDQYAQESKIASDTRALFELARAAHPQALEIVERVCHYITLALCSISTVLNPELIVIGGSIGRYSDVLIPLLEDELASYLPKVPQLVGTALGGNASLRGAIARSLEVARASLITGMLL